MALILAVDDDVAMTDFYRALFEEAGYTVKTAPDATSALILLRQISPDLIVLDAEMPAGGGEKVFEIARDVLGRGVPVIFVTGMPERVSRFALTKTKVRVFSKPVKADELLSTVAEMTPG